MTTAFLILDAGTGAGRALVVDDSGQVLASVYQEWSFQQESDVPGSAFFDPRMLENALLDCSSEAVWKSGLKAEQIGGVAVTSLREGVVFLDPYGKELYVGPSFDERASAEGQEIAEQCGEDMYFTSGTYPPAYGYAARLRWFKRHGPGIYDQICTVLTIGDWINYRLCGELFSEPSLACASGLFDVRRADWCAQLAASLDVDESWLPPVLTSGKRAGSLRVAVADRIGLKPATPVVVGGGDTQCAMLGMGLTQPWKQGCVAGTTSPVQQVTEEPIFDQHMRTWTNCQLMPGRYSLESNAIVTGLSFRWLREFLGDDIDYEDMNALAESAPPGSGGVHAFLGAEIMDMSHYQASWTGGVLFPVPPGEFRKEELVRALLESHAYAVRANVEQIESITAGVAGELYICGGQTAGMTGMQILSNVLDRSLHIHGQQSSAVGAAMCAAVGAGTMEDLEVAAGVMAGDVVVVEPDDEPAGVYQEYYSKWKTLYHQLRDKIG